MRVLHVYCILSAIGEDKASVCTETSCDSVADMGMKVHLIAKNLPKYKIRPKDISTSENYLNGYFSL